MSRPMGMQAPLPTDPGLPQVAFTPIVELTTDDVVALSMETASSDGRDYSLRELARLGVLDRMLGRASRDGTNRLALHATVEDVHHPDLSGALTDWLERWGLLAREVELRVAPRGPLEVDAARRLDHLRTLGFRLVLERFGEAASSLQWLREVPFDFVEIAPSYAENLGRSPRDRLMFSSVVELCSRLGATVDASGLATASDVEFAKAIGIERGQGRYWAI